MSSWLRHVSTAKHIQLQPINKKVPNVCLCGKQYTNRSGLWKHSKKCMFTLDLVEPENLAELEDLAKPEDLAEPVVSQDLLQELIAENKDLTLLVLKLVQKLFCDHNFTFLNN
jgi:hypothetical protein